MAEYIFEAAKIRDALVNEIRDFSARLGFKKVVIGISGGKDSTVTAALCARALGKENVYGVMLPDGEQKDISDSIRVIGALGINYKTVNIGKMHKALLDEVDASNAEDGAFRLEYNKTSDINVAPRLRMTTLRYIAQALGAFLAGTGNLSEATVGYCTKDGDTSCDFSVLGKLTSVEVVEVGLAMEELPRDLVVKTPADGLTGKSDEDNLGIRYADIHAYLRHGSCGNADTDEAIRRKERANMHKRRMPLTLDPFAYGAKQ